MESVDVTVIDHHVGGCVLVLVDAGEAGLLEPERGGVEDGRPALAVVLACRVARIVRVERAPAGRQLAEDLCTTQQPQLQHYTGRIVLGVHV